MQQKVTVSTGAPKKAPDITRKFESEMQLITIIFLFKPTVAFDTKRAASFETCLTSGSAFIIFLMRADTKYERFQLVDSELKTCLVKALQAARVG